MAKKLTPKKAQEILRDGTVHGKPLTGKQKRFFGWMSQKHYHMKPYLEDGGVIMPNDITAQAGTTVYVSNPNDPQLNAYNDSLNLYRFSQNLINQAKQNIKSDFEEGYDSPKRSDYYIGKSRFSADKKIKPVKTYYRIGKNLGLEIPVYKKPVQPVIYDPNLKSKTPESGKSYDVKKAPPELLRAVKEFQNMPENDPALVARLVSVFDKYKVPKIKRPDGIMEYNLHNIDEGSKPPAPKPEKPLTKQKPQAVPYEIPDISIQAGTPVPKTIGQEPTNYSVTFRDENSPSKQRTQYFPDLESWKNFTDNAGYMHRDYTADGKSAQAVGYNKFKGGGGIIADDGTGIVYPQDGVVAHAGPGYQGLGYSNSGYNYNSAWGGRFQTGGAVKDPSKLPYDEQVKYVDSTLHANMNKDFVKRLYDSRQSIPQPFGTPDWNPFNRSTHLMSYDPGSKRVYPSVVNINGKLQHLPFPDEAWNYADDNKEYIEFPTAEAAEWFANSTSDKSGYKMGTNVLKNINPVTGIPYTSKKEMGGYIPEAQAGIELGAIPTQETYMGRPVGNKLTPPPSGMSVPLTTEAQRYSNRQKSNYAPDTIGPTPAKRSAIAKGLAMVAHPMTTAQYLVKNQDIPDYLEKNPNAYDYATPFVNPASSIYAGFQVPGNLSRGEYTQAGLNTLAVLPGLKSLPKATRAAINAGDRAFSPVGRALNKIEQEGLAAGMSKFDIAKRQLNNVGITSNQREAYVPGLSEFARKYVTPYGYTGKFGNNKLQEVIKNIKEGGVDYNASVIPARSDAWNMYLGFPQKHRTFRLSETAPASHPAYSPKQLKGMDIYSLNRENLIGEDIMSKTISPRGIEQNFEALNNPSFVRIDPVNVMGNYNARFTNEGLQYNDIWDLNPKIEPFKYLPSGLQNYFDDSRLFFNKFTSPGGSYQQPKTINLSIDKFLGKPFMSHGNLPSVTKESFKNTFQQGLLKELEEARHIQKTEGYDMTPKIERLQKQIQRINPTETQFQMGGSVGGGSLPGAAGMMYARTGSTYRDKKEAGGMLYYEQGLDWQPRTISEAGSTVPVSSRGLYDHPNQVVDVPTPDGSITMADIDYPVYGVDNTGMEQMMMPGGEYQFDGDMVRETPMMKAGGEMIKRADGSYSRRGLWDNIRANKGSGKKPTKEMLKQERKIKRSMEEGGVVAQAGTEVTPQAPPQPSKKSQLDLVLESPSKFDNGKTFHDIVKEVATESKIDPRLLWSSSFVEGMNLAALKPSQVSNAYLAEHERSPKILDYPVDGFYNYGLDNFGDTYPELVKRGYLPKDFDYYSYKTTNEQNRPIKTAAFRSNRDAVMAKAAYLKYEADRVKHYAAKQKLELTPDEQAFFTMAAYNGGLGSAQAMLEDLKKSGLTPSAFIKQGKTSKGQVYKNVKPRYDMMFKVANMFEAGGEVKTIQDMGQLKKLDQLTNFTNYNYYE